MKRTPNQFKELKLKINQLQEEVVSIDEQLSKYDTLNDDLMQLIEHKIVLSLN